MTGINAKKKCRRPFRLAIFAFKRCRRRLTKAPLKEVTINGWRAQFCPIKTERALFATRAATFLRLCLKGACGRSSTIKGSQRCTFTLALVGKIRSGNFVRVVLYGFIFLEKQAHCEQIFLFSCSLTSRKSKDILDFINYFLHKRTYLSSVYAQLSKSI